MKKVSQAYKDAMNKDIREQGFISVVLAEVNGIAQNEAKFLTQGAYWSNSESPFDSTTQQVKYATLENGYTRADGKFLVMPREGESYLLDSAMLCPCYMEYNQYLYIDKIVLQIVYCFLLLLQISCIYLAHSCHLLLLVLLLFRYKYLRYFNIC